MKNTISITGGKPLHGTVTIGGAKNAISKMMIASLLTDQPVTLRNVPDISEVDITADILEAVGARVIRDGNELNIHTPKITNTKVAKQSRQNRLSVLAISPLLHRAGHAELPLASGDNIGPRPVNFHINALKQMGATFEEKQGEYDAQTTGLHGATIHLPFPTVMGTENIILAATLAKGRTYIHNAAIEPEIVDLIKMLQQMGAIIEFRANRVIIIDGVERLGGVDFTVMPDRMEAASYAVAAIATGGDILVKGAKQDDMITFLNTLRRVGASYQIESDGIRFARGNQPLRGIELETDTHPGFMTDWQQPMVVLLTQAQGMSVIHETVFEDRFGYTEALRQMGANIGVFSKCLGELHCRFKGKGYKHSAIIGGATPLTATDIEMPDIRAGMAYVIAALVAPGTSRLSGVEHLIRGYGPTVTDKLSAIGADFSTD
ncbi:UDP-N-acetylglucosamine 1-carboxyvinyltransferase [Patescibacteria group bacterium]|nr:MAG: UDP-N-acetylglucosamine 1-carboxyvinyltransferase [Patescibacteria group bacterium]